MRYLSIILLLVFVSSCRDRHEQFASDDVVADIMLPTTPVKDQGRSPLCWIYAMLATIETDRIAAGDSVNLSAMWLTRKSLEEQAVQSYLTGCGISMRGTLMEAMRLFHAYGIVGYDAAPSPQSMGQECSREVEQVAQSMAAQHQGIGAMQDALADVLDRTVGPMPRYAFMFGMEYTPQEFARSCAMPGEWQAYTSFTHHPFGKPFCLELKDNMQRHEAINVPADTLYNMVVRSLRSRHPVAWEGSLREVKSEKTLREVKSEKLKVKSYDYPVRGGGGQDFQTVRQKAFESFRLTDDHCMAIVGMGHRKDGTPVLICKNSWGREDGNGGFRYMTREEFMLSTILVMLNLK